MTKVSVYLDATTIQRLRHRALRQHGTMRSLSREVEDAVRESFLIDELEAALTELGGDGDAEFGFGDIRPIKLGSGPSLTQMVREQREHRHEVSPRRQRRA